MPLNLPTLYSSWSRILYNRTEANCCRLLTPVALSRICFYIGSHFNGFICLGHRCFFFYSWGFFWQLLFNIDWNVLFQFWNAGESTLEVRYWSHTLSEPTYIVPSLWHCLAKLTRKIPAPLPLRRSDGFIASRTTYKPTTTYFFTSIFTQPPTSLSF